MPLKSVQPLPSFHLPVKHDPQGCSPFLLQGLGLVFVAVYQKALKLLYVDELLERVNKSFAPRYKPGCFEYPEFDATFQVGRQAGWRAGLMGLHAYVGGDREGKLGVPAVGTPLPTSGWAGRLGRQVHGPKVGVGTRLQMGRCRLAGHRPVLSPCKCSGAHGVFVLTPAP